MFDEHKFCFYQTSPACSHTSAGLFNQSKHTFLIRFFTTTTTKIHQKLSACLHNTPVIWREKCNLSKPKREKWLIQWSREQRERCWLVVSADRTPHEPLLPERHQSAEPQLLGLLLIHEQLQEGTETPGQQPQGGRGHEGSYALQKSLSKEGERKKAPLIKMNVLIVRKRPQRSDS